MLGFIKNLIGEGSTRSRRKRMAWKQIGHGQDGVPRWVRKQAYQVMEDIERKSMQPDMDEETHFFLKGRRYRYKIILKGGRSLYGGRIVIWDRTYRAPRRR